MAKLTPIPIRQPSPTLVEAEQIRLAFTGRDLIRPSRYGPGQIASDLVSRVAGTKVAGAISIKGASD